MGHAEQRVFWVLEGIGHGWFTRGQLTPELAEAGRIIRTTHRGGPARQGASPSLRGTLRTRCGVDGGSVWRCRVPARLGDELLGAPTRLVRNGSARRGVPSSALAAAGAGSGARAGRSACGVSPTPGRSSSRSCVLYACAQAFWGAKHAPAGDFGRRFAMASKVYHANSTQQHQQRAERRARTCARVRACAGG